VASVPSWHWLSDTDPNSGYRWLESEPPKPWSMNVYEERDAPRFEPNFRPWWLNNEDPNTRTQWVLIQPCGCAVGVLDGRAADNALGALAEFYDGIEDASEALKAGTTLRKMTHAEYYDKYAQHMSLDWECPHVPQPSFWRKVWNVVQGKGW
jgi:hypothetical protein